MTPTPSEVAEAYKYADSIPPSSLRATLASKVLESRALEAENAALKDFISRWDDKNLESGAYKRGLEDGAKRMENGRKKAESELAALRSSSERMREALNKCLDEIATLPRTMMDAQLKRVFYEGQAALSSTPSSPKEKI